MPGGFFVVRKKCVCPVKVFRLPSDSLYDSGAAGSQPDRSPGIVNIVSTRPKPKENTMLGINTNVSSLTAQRNLSGTTNAMSTTLQRLSSGLRINSAKDDAAGLAIADRMTSQIRGLDQARRNANDGVSLAQTAEGALGEIGNNVQRIRELAVQSANATNKASDRQTIQNEAKALLDEIDRVAGATEFNGIKLLNGGFTAQNFQVGANAGQTITVNGILDARTTQLGQRFSSSTTSTAAGTGVTAAHDITINGTSVQQSRAGSANGQSASSAWAVANAINNSGIDGVTATANATTVTGAGAVTDAAINGLTINNVAVGAVTAQGSVAATGNALVVEINKISAATGVSASLDANSKIVLTAADGRDIVVNGSGAGDAIGDTNAQGTIKIESESDKGITFGGADAGNAAAIFGTGIAAQAAGPAGKSLGLVDLSTAAGAQDALKTLDAALKQINGSRASLGAIQNRFTSTITNLQTTSENLSASRSRVMDADFASETANLSRNQVLQQAGTAMLAQANQAPQIALQLLR
ncbi:flagellin N-terminal helical domain-containing protein [Laribacter hongkongensis]|uniref:flagellin N-terminal helical domain-containing protein n=1 Tax=Laribacter hongkongensis TaxID=168471 RepID=UPI0023D85CED|nr:flagellin [Laribacter hongkongensis]